MDGLIATPSSADASSWERTASPGGCKATLCAVARVSDTAPWFNGASLDVVLPDRLRHQLGGVFKLLRDGEWRALDEIQAFAGGRESAVSARLRIGRVCDSPGKVTSAVCSRD